MGTIRVTNLPFIAFFRNDNPEFFDLCKAQGWVNRDDYMTLEECAAVTDEQMTQIVDKTTSKAKNCKSLEQLQYFTGLTIIPAYCFMNCRLVTKIVLPPNIVTINNYGISNLPVQDFVIPNSVHSIGNFGCAYLRNKKLRLPDNVNYLLNNPFDNNPNLEKISVSKSNTTFDSRENCNAIIETQTNSLRSGCMNTFIPNTVKIIGTGAFRGAKKLYSIAIPNSVTTIERFAFDESGLISITIPSSVISIGQSFTSCKNLATISVDTTNTKYDSRNNCNAIIETATNTLVLGCKNTVIPNSVTSIGIGAFSKCAGLTNIVIPNSITTINNGAFSTCTGLTSVTIPNSVTNIGLSAFAECSGLESVTMERSTPPTLGTNVFNKTSPNLTIYVPSASVAAYKAATNWKTYSSRIIGY